MSKEGGGKFLTAEELQSRGLVSNKSFADVTVLNLTQDATSQSWRADLQMKGSSCVASTQSDHAFKMHCPTSEATNVSASASASTAPAAAPATTATAAKEASQSPHASSMSQ